MATLKVSDLTKNFGKTQVLKQINLDVSDGEFIVLLGPSGCGKSTLLNMIAGLESVDEGEILIDEYVVNRVEPKDRNIAMVFQSYALYPAMTVRDNVTFGLKQRKVSKEKIEQSLKHFSKMLQIDQLLERKPAQLSGGQRQRVAMGRALVREPQIFLFDEPLSNLDAKLRIEMRHEINKLHEQLGTTMIYVTHDQVEAMSLATRIAVMNEGIIQQIGTPQEIYDKPNSVFVADFIGSPAINLIHGTYSKNGAEACFIPDLQKDDFKIPLSDYAFESEPKDGQQIIFGFRPEHINLPDVSLKSSMKVELKPTLIELTGYEKEVSFEFFGNEVTGRLPRHIEAELAKPISLNLDLSEISIFDSASTLRL
ncbi:MAG: sn-glycerol-3-phosphate ABC transporter ATP-binding protein UgpC [SAR324 cluster bacterium]|nr:sn-glycerol-3-phosphate ABC transporter ATP-binding protein UgpC [SAR324 cluster bacterium]